VAAKLDLLLEKAQMTLAAQKELAEHFQSKLQYDAHKEKIISSLHSELQSYKKDLVQKTLQPLVLDLINTIDNLKKKLRQEQTNTPGVVSVLTEITEELNDVLVRQGVIAYENDGFFDASKQKIRAIISTTDASQGKTIALSLASGYEWEGKILRPQLVDVLKCDTVENE
jgi:molecular chaperone GrpE